ncbi:hypothetical protein SAMN02745221_00715 [Thermosyntropha lipolytica DSM 11003]|uniref:PilX N-terminal n=1 Tax=Thermosyntropha lipolytica DSM 11003 TaxID=1123382 RepID=A0A1M5LN83_9FIRM|nr:hypothetical protein [Thermosyntropha lipolytica]SHG66508.1 hypothetical protein SAMN02745221_00715 [Thermosyntropha lipolytica DSM 11003]
MLKKIKAVLQNHRGIALPVVLILFIPISILAYSALSLTSSQTNFNYRYQAGIDALHYAEAGIHHYLWALNKNKDFPDLDQEVAFEQGKYRIKVLEQGNGYVKIASTGWTDREPEIKKTITAVLGQRTFTRYSYFSVDDPSNIRWTSNDIVYGPYHTNGHLVIDGNPTFYGRVTYSGRIHFYNGVWRGGSEDPDFNGPYPVNGSSPRFMQGIRWAVPLEVPPSNSELKIRAQNGGYYYEGRTSIRLNPDGTVTVRYFKKIDNYTYEDVTETLPLPPNGVIYVNSNPNIPGGNESHGKFDKRMGNAFVSGTLRGKLTIAAANDIYITGYDPTDYNFNSARNKPTGAGSGGNGGVIYAATTFAPVYENGTLTGYKAEGDDMLGLVANNNIWILCKGWFDNPNPRLTDLQANVTPKYINVYGAVFALDGSFGLEKYYPNPSDGRYWPTGSYNNKDYKYETIYQRGALIQKTRGIVGQDISSWFSSSWLGYRSKNYAYDDRMTYEAPPHFIEPSNRGWEIISWEEN